MTDAQPKPKPGEAGEPMDLPVDLIAEAKDNLGVECATVLDACEAFWGNGTADEQAGSATEPPFEHIYRVAHCIVRTDDQGLRHLTEYGSEDAAKAAFTERAGELEVAGDD